MKLRSPKYLSYVRSFPCLICGGAGGRSSAHHMRHMEGYGMGTKVGDQWTVPLCGVCHGKCHEHGDEGLFWAMQGVDGPAWAAKTFRKWREQEGGYDGDWP